ncbi:hypothetical protein [Citrobacter europaeus]|uniref:hypothetical protein n=1 Tax=Citrobacter europaeus TaxID=1914243 RepID=UPI0039C0E50C
MSTAVLNVKIDEALKEKLRHYAEVHNENLSIATEKLLLIAFSAVEEAGVSAVEEAGVSAEDIDSQHTEESVVEALTPKEIKALRRLLKKKK